MTLCLKRAYEAPAASDGYRILVDRLWPRGLNKEEAQIDLWLKDIAPSADLRRWFGHDPNKWAEFREQYCQELAAKSELLQQITTPDKSDVVTLIYAAKDSEHNNAVVLKAFLEKTVD